MTLQDLGSAGEFAGAVAVFISLIYLAIQIRRNTRALMASTEHSVSHTWNELNVRFGTDSDAAGLLLRGWENYSELDLEERFRFTLLMRSIMQVHFDTWRQVQYGHIPAEIWQLNFSSLAIPLSRPAARTWWETNRHLYLPSFQSEVEKLLASQQSDEADRP
jgi:hypothetical protein